MTDRRIPTFEAFWPYYLGEHSKPATRWLHFIGTSIGLAVAALSIGMLEPWLLPASLLPGYAFAWVSHFLIERNKPASWTYPLWSFMADFKLWAFMITGRIGDEVARHGIA
jgi:hypothetical protein